MSEITEGNTYLEEIQKRGILPALGTEFSGGDCIEQNPNELAAFCEWLAPLEIKSYLEVGTSSGGLLKFMVEVMGVRGHGIDLMLPTAIVDDQDFYSGFQGDSHSALAKEWAKKAGPFDLVFIDACHEHADIALDTEAFMPLASKVVAWHDVAGLRACEGSKQHWETMKQINMHGSGQCHEFIDSEIPVGIGALRL